MVAHRDVQPRETPGDSAGDSWIGPGMAGYTHQLGSSGFSGLRNMDPKLLACSLEE